MDRPSGGFLHRRGDGERRTLAGAPSSYTPLHSLVFVWQSAASVGGGDRYGTGTGARKSPRGSVARSFRSSSSGIDPKIASCGLPITLELGWLWPPIGLEPLQFK